MIQLFSRLFRGKKLHKQKAPNQRKKTDGRSTRVVDFLDIASLGVSGSTWQNYQTALRSFQQFNQGKTPVFADLTANRLADYERWLRQQGVCPNTSSCYMRSLRAVYNKAVEKRYIKRGNPFTKVFAGNEKTVKRTLSRRDIGKLQTACLTDEHEEVARNFFLFSLYAMGMPFADMARLKQRQITNGVLTYHRQKTGKKICLKIEPCMARIIEKYARTDTDYLFPILYKVKGGKAVPQGYTTALWQYNRLLKQVAARVRIQTNLTSYVARHSWASMAYQENVDLNIISQALGHTDTQTTRIYIADIENRQIAQANHKILRGLITTPLAKR